MCSTEVCNHHTVGRSRRMEQMLCFATGTSRVNERRFCQVIVGMRYLGPGCAQHDEGGRKTNGIPPSSTHQTPWSFGPACSHRWLTSAQVGTGPRTRPGERRVTSCKPKNERPPLRAAVLAEHRRAHLDLPAFSSLFHAFVRVDGNVHPAVFGLAVGGCIVGHGLRFAVTRCGDA